MNISSAGPVASRDRVQLSKPQRPWQDDILYFAMTDRFENGDRSNDGGTDPSNDQRFHGGDWQGIINKLDDLKQLGVTALWISPVQENDRDFLGTDGYHGYWPRDFYRTEPAFGDLPKLRELVQKSHEKGVKVLLDLVLNHTGYNHPWTTDESKQDYFHDRKLSFTQDMVAGGLFGLPDLAQEKPEVGDYLIEMAKHWARETGCDGFRLDAIMHFPAEFQQKFADEMKKEFGEGFFLLGEAYTGPAQRVADFQTAGKMDSVYDFPLSEALRNVAGHNEDLGLIGRWRQFFELKKEFPGEAYRVRQARPEAQQLQAVFAQDKAYPNPNLLTTLVENHDMPRFITAAGPNALQKFQQALAVEFTARGIPLLYYGAEDGMGLQKHDLRADKRHGADPQMRAYVEQLTALRQDCIALRRGEQKELYCDDRTYAFARVHPEQTVVAAFNFDRKEAEKTIPLPGANLVLQDRLSGEKFYANGSELDLALPAHGSAILEVVGTHDRPVVKKEPGWLGIDWASFLPWK
jgi:alpha-amylase